MKEGEQLGMTAAEKALFDHVGTEHVGIAGTEIEYWQINLTNSVRDPLYGEPAYRKYNGPYRMKALMGYPDHAPIVGQEGFSSTFDATMYITRAALEEAGVVGGPAESDIIRVWDAETYWSKNTSVDGYNVPGAGLYLSITDVREEGVLFDTATFLGFTLTLRRTTIQTPERKITNNL